MKTSKVVLIVVGTVIGGTWLARKTGVGVLGFSK